VKEQDDEREDDLSDEMKREDGLVRYWMFFNGDQVRLFSALVAALLGVLGASCTFSAQGERCWGLSYWCSL
jgi:hypothetical protein